MITGIGAVVLAAAGSAFTTHSGKFSNQFWFALNSNGFPIATSTKPTSLASDPFTCGGSHVPCAAAYTNYSTITGPPVHYSAVVLSEIGGTTAYKN